VCGMAILELHRLLVLHFIVGFLLVGPVLLKIGSTGYRFVRYYTGSPGYLRKGPPAPIQRMLGPLVIVTSVAVLGTGVILAVVGPGSGRWLFLHKASFILWFGVMTIHVLNYAPRLPSMLAARPTRRAESGHPLLAGSARVADACRSRRGRCWCGGAGHAPVGAVGRLRIATANPPAMRGNRLDRAGRLSPPAVV
jgi:hypothetical protein